MPKTDPNSSKFSIVLDVLVLFTCIFLMSVIVFLVIFCAFNPRAIIFLATWMPQKHYKYFPTGFLALLFHGYLLICLGFSMCICATLLITYLYSVTMFYTKELVLGQQCYGTLGILRSNPENLRHVSRAFQLINSNLMCFLGMCLVYFHSAFMLLPSFGSFLLITYWDKMNLIEKGTIGSTIWAVLFFWTSVLQFGKYLWVSSNNILWSWNGIWWGSKKETMIMRKFRKSCRPVLLQNGTMLVIARLTQLRYMKGVLRGTFRSLLTLTSSLKSK